MDIQAPRLSAARSSTGAPRSQIPWTRQLGTTRLRLSLSCKESSQISTGANKGSLWVPRIKSKEEGAKILLLRCLVKRLQQWAKMLSPPSKTIRHQLRTQNRSTRKGNRTSKTPPNTSLASKAIHSWRQIRTNRSKWCLKDRQKWMDHRHRQWVGKACSWGKSWVLRGQMVLKRLLRTQPPRELGT